MNHIIAFSHIPKTGGLTLESILRRNFGMSHVTVFYRRVSKQAIYRASDFRRDLRIHPRIRSLSGHALKAHSDLDEVGIPIKWYTLIRDPAKRFLSLYQHQYSRGRDQYRIPFQEWMETFVRTNQMVRWIAGEEDLEAAKQLIDEKFAFVGVMEKYDASLVLLKRAVGMPRLNIGYERPVNKAPNEEVRNQILASYDKYRDEVEQRNVLDRALYDFVMRTVWTEHAERFGIEELDAAVQTEVGRTVGPLRKLRFLENRIYRNLVYKPAIRILVK